MPDTIYLPNGKPAPPLLTEAEAAALLRLGAKDRYQALRRCREQGLKATKIGARLGYLTRNVVEFMERATAGDPR